MADRAEVSFHADVEIRKSGPEILDDLQANLRATNPASFGLIAGSMRLRNLVNVGVNSGGIDRYVAGRDAAHQLDIPASYAGDGLMTRMPAPDVDLVRIHMLTDMPSRLEHSTGRAKLMDVARFATALGLAASRRAQARSTLRLITDEGLSKVFEGGGKDIVWAVSAVDDAAQGDNSHLGYIEPGAGLKEGLRDIIDQPKASNPHEDVILVTSDLLSGFNRETGDFDWQDDLHRAHGMFGDRLLVARLISPTQKLFADLGSTGMNHFDQMKARKSFTDLYRQKQAVLDDVLSGMRVGNIDTASDTSIQMQLEELLT